MPEKLPEGTITNDGVVQKDGSIKPFGTTVETLKDNTKKALVPQKIEDPQIDFDEAKIALIKAKFAPDATNTEFELFLYMAKKYNLDPLIRQIWLVKFGNSPAQIYAGRDGYLQIAHRSGHFNGMKSWCEYDEDKPVKGHCIVWRNDMEHPFETEVLVREYSTGKNLWASKPSVMIVKVAESMCLRKAFSVSGIYSPEEMGE
jgi:phage recombination protein Bet